MHHPYIITVIALVAPGREAIVEARGAPTARAAYRAGRRMARVAAKCDPAPDCRRTAASFHINRVDPNACRMLLQRPVEFVAADYVVRS